MTKENHFKLARTKYNRHGPQSIREVSKATGITGSLIEDLETDDETFILANKKPRDVGFRKVKALALHYGVSVDFLLDLSETHSQKVSIQTAVKCTGLSEQAINRIQLETAPIAGLAIPGNETKLIEALNTMLTSTAFWKIVKLLCGYISTPKQALSKGAEAAQEYNLIYYGAVTNTDVGVKDILAYKMQKSLSALLDEVDENKSETQNRAKQKGRTPKKGGGNTEQGGIKK